MPFAIESVHRQFFHTQGWVQFDHVLSSRQVEQIRSRLMPLSQKMLDPRTNYELGRDLHLKDPTMHKFALEVGSIASGLWNERPIVLLGDQLLFGPVPAIWTSILQARSKQSPKRSASELEAIKGLCIDEIWSAQPTLGAIAVALDLPNIANSVSDQNSQQPSMAHMQSGSAFCLKHSTMGLVPPSSGKMLWLFVFGTDQARFVKAEVDPLSDYYRQRGVPENGRLVGMRPSFIAR